MGVLETSFCSFLKRPVPRFLHFCGLKMRFMPIHEPHCSIDLIQGQSSKVMRKDPNHCQGERSKVKVKRERHAPLKWASWKRSFLPFCESTCSPFSAFWRPENTIYAELWTPLSNKFNSRSRFKGHAKRANSWPGWKFKGQGQTRKTQTSIEMGVLETSFCRFVKRPVANFLHFGGL